MAYPPPPGISNANNNPSHPSLPARPPPSKASSGFKPAFRPSAPPAYSSAPSYASAPAAPSQYGPSFPSYSQPPVTAAPYQSQPQAYQYPQASYQQSSSNAPPSGNSYVAAPQIRNPFPLPGASADYDPEMAAQIAQWQSAYVSKDATKETAPTGRAAVATTISAAPTSFAPPESDAAKADKKKTVVREGGGKKWTDDSLLEWDPSHLRLFVGNLAGETTDESLMKAFSRWKSVQKARVIRDKRSTKSKGFGFVSFSDADDFFQAAKEMNGKYIQSHPVVVRKANTEIKVSNVKEKDKGKKHKNKNGNGNKQSDAGFEPNLGPSHHGGIQKPGQKTKNGLKLLG